MHPLAPYAYEVQYRDGRRLRWDSPGGPWGEATMPIRTVHWLIVHGPGFGRIALLAAGPIVGFIFRTAETLTLPGPARTRRTCIGVRRADDLIEAVRIDEQGHPSHYRGAAQGW
jgi:hypothetical protein